MLRFFLKINDGAAKEVYPIIDDSYTLNEVKEKGYFFARKTLDQALIFKKQDYDLINSQPLETVFYLSGELDGVDLGVSAKFTKADIQNNISEKEITVTPESADEYEDILNSLNKEFNVVEITPKTSLKYEFRPLLQVYAKGTAFVSNFLGGNYWELPVSPEDDETILQNDFIFGKIGWSVFCPGDLDVSGKYIPVLGGVEHASILDHENGNFRVLKETVSSVLKWVIKDISGGAGNFVTVYVSDETADSDPLSNCMDSIYPMSEKSFTFRSIADNTKIVRFFGGKFFARMLTNSTSGVLNTQPLPEPDFTDSNYQRALSIDDLEIVLSDQNSINVTRFGTFSEDAEYRAGTYFVAPDNAFPILRTQWTEVSFWGIKNSNLQTLEDSAGKEFTTKDAFLLVDVINAFLQSIGSIVTHDVSDSAFLYERGRSPMIVPKGNVIFGDYDQPTKKAILTFAEILELFKFYNCGWHVENGKFKVEHFEFYENGHKYGGENVGANLNVMIDPKSGRSWLYGSLIVSYEKEDLPELIRFKFAETVSEAFEGFPIFVESVYVQKGNIEDIQTVFVSDIDFLLSQSTSVDQAGFLWCEAVLDVDVLKIPIDQIEGEPDQFFNLQNLHCSLIYLLPEYHKRGLPAKNVKINNVAIVADSVKRSKVLEAEIGEIQSFKIEKLVSTEIGNGLIGENRLNLHNHTRNLKIYYAPE